MQGACPTHYCTWRTCKEFKPLLLGAPLPLCTHITLMQRRPCTCFMNVMPQVQSTAPPVTALQSFAPSRLQSRAPFHLFSPPSVALKANLFLLTVEPPP